MSKAMDPQWTTAATGCQDGARNPDAAGFESGDVLAGRYRLDERIGRGAMTVVWAATDHAAARCVAIKTPRAAGVASRIPREARMLRQVDHPGVLKFHATGHDRGVPFLTTELVRGPSVSELLLAPHRPGDRRRPLDKNLWLRFTAALMADLARAVDAVHERGLIHRDLKPSNVMLRANGRPVVIDFDLAGRIGEPAGGGLCGSPRYLAPERTLRLGVRLHPRGDIYQLGILLYELLTGRHPFPGTDTGEVLTRIRRGQFVLPRTLDPGIPIELERVCLRAMHARPERRYGAASDMARELQAYPTRRTAGRGGGRRSHPSRVAT